MAWTVRKEVNLELTRRQIPGMMPLSITLTTRKAYQSYPRGAVRVVQWFRTTPGIFGDLRTLAKLEMADRRLYLFSKNRRAIGIVQILDAGEAEVMFNIFATFVTMVDISQHDADEKKSKFIEIQGKFAFDLTERQ